MLFKGALSSYIPEPWIFPNWELKAAGCPPHPWLPLMHRPHTHTLRVVGTRVAAIQDCSIDEIRMSKVKHDGATLDEVRLPEATSPFGSAPVPGTLGSWRPVYQSQAVWHQRPNPASLRRWILSCSHNLRYVKHLTHSRHLASVESLNSLLSSSVPCALSQSLHTRACQGRSLTYLLDISTGSSINPAIPEKLSAMLYYSWGHLQFEWFTTLKGKETQTQLQCDKMLF